MSETRYEDRTDSVEVKLNLLQAARLSGNYELAMSLSESLKDTLTLERDRRGEAGQSAVPAQPSGRVVELPDLWAQWAKGWEYFRAITLRETVGIPRTQEPVDLLLGFPLPEAADLRRELRVARIDHDSGTLQELPSQVYGESRRGDGVFCRVVWLATVPAKGKSTYLLFSGNPKAELPDYETDLKVSGEGFGVDVSNHHYTAHLSRQMGQLERLTYRRAHGLELFAGGEGHGEPPDIDWAHDYLASNEFQKFRVTNWATCPNYEVVKGPLCVKVKRWGFPHSPVHPLFTPSRMHITVTYTFYAGASYFMKEGRMEVLQDFDINYLRDDEWVFSGYSFTDTVWVDRQGALHEGEAPQRDQDDLWGVGFFHRHSRDAFIALWLEHEAEHFDALYHCGSPVLNYNGHGQLWSRWAARNKPHFKAGALLRQRNAYLTAPYHEETGAAAVEELRRRLLNPLQVEPGDIPVKTGATSSESLARPGETEDSEDMKSAVWAALREVRDDMLYTVDANVVDMGYVYDVRVRGDTVYVLMTMPHRGRPKFRYLGNSIRERLVQVEGVGEVIIDVTWEPAWTVNRLSDKGREAMGLSED
ncbi:MAG: metal-sulfur cluster assembly factor [Armatimonadetes bacterium]|nr:metal-sulfur cluster assembly factor [Armatimonadota bacterium]